MYEKLIGSAKIDLHVLMLCLYWPIQHMCKVAN